MTDKMFRKIKIIIISFVSATVGLAVIENNILLALAGLVIGVLFFMLVRHKTKQVVVDERIKSISGYAARLTYVIVTVLLGLLSLFFILTGSRTGEIYMEALGTILSYITLLSVAIYSMSYKFFEKKYGANDK